VTLFRRLILLSAFCAAPATAQGFQDLEVLEARVTGALGADVGAPGGPAYPIDRRLKLAACPAPVTVDAPAMNAVAVRCEPLGWRIRVPVLAAEQSASAPRAKIQPVVRKGDQVEVVAGGASFTVSTLAIAEQDGAPGDRIRVRSDRKSAPVIGEVTDDGRISLPGFK
jgi:flagella basal body P-ring formation protein FlgA